MRIKEGINKSAVPTTLFENALLLWAQSYWFSMEHMRNMREARALGNEGDARYHASTARYWAKHARREWAYAYERTKHSVFHDRDKAVSLV